MTRNQLYLLDHLLRSDKFEGKTILEVCWMLGQEAAGFQKFSMHEMTSNEQLDVILIFHGRRNDNDELNIKDN